MLRTIIIDDERSSQEILAAQLAANCPEVELVAMCSNADEAEATIVKYQPDLIFLDIEMPDSTGFDLLKRLKKVDFEIVFITGFSQYAIQAIRFSALDFLLKPIVVEDLMEAVRRAGQKITMQNQREKIDTLLDNIQYLNIDKKLALPTLTGLEFVTLGNIIRCESDNNYTIFHMVDKTKIVVCKSIGVYEDLLKDFHFLRVHQSHIINLRYVKSYQKGEGGLIIMEDQSAVDVSRRRKEQLISRLSGI